MCFHFVATSALLLLVHRLQHLRVRHAIMPPKVCRINHQLLLPRLFTIPLLASCGQAPPGCPACPLASALCPSNPADRTWIEIGLDQESDLFNISTGDTVVVRWYLPADKGGFLLWFGT